MQKTDFTNRLDLKISDEEFLKAFKQDGERVYFRLIHDVLGISRNDDCAFTQEEYEYPLLQKVFYKRQREGYGVFF